MNLQNQHYVPKFVLRQFLADTAKEQVYVYDKHTDRSFSTSIKNIMAAPCLGLFVTIVTATRYVFLGTICGTLLFATLSFVPALGHTAYFQIFAVVMAFVVVFRHLANVQRLLAGAENKLTF